MSNGRYFSAELLRAKGSALQWLPLLAVPLVLMTYPAAMYVAAEKDAIGILNWQALYATGLAAPILAIFAATAESREEKANFGGTRWRSVSHTRQRIARLVVVFLSVLAFHILNFGGTWLIATLAGRAGSGKIVLLGAYSFIGALGIVGLAAACARLSNFIVTALLFFAWQIVGTLRIVVEGDFWWGWPMAWPIRLVLPVLGVHQNAVPLEPEDPLNFESPWLAIALCLLLAVIGLVAAVRTPEQVNVRRRKAKAEVVHAYEAISYTPAVVARSADRRPRALSALTRAVLAPAVASCLALTAVALLMTALTYPPSYVHGFFTYVILPLGAGILPILVWPTLQTAWSVMQLEYQRSASALLIWLGACVATVSVFASLTGIIAGGDIVDELRRFLLSCVVGSILIFVAFQLEVRFGMAVSLAITLIVAIFSVTIGGDVLASTPLWFPAFAAWAETATSSSRMVTAFIVGGAAALGLYWWTVKMLKQWVPR